MLKKFLQHIELILSAAGVAVIFLIPALVGPGPGGYWKIVALTAIFVGVLHGIIFWIIRSRQRRVRAEAIHEIRMMLHDRINNALATIMIQTSFTHDELAQRQAQLEAIQKSVEKISSQLEDVSDESLAKWKDRYSNAVSARA